MLTQERRTALSNVTGLSKFKLELNRIPAIDAGDYIADLPTEQRAIAFRLLNKDQAIAVFEYLPSEVQEELLGSLQTTQIAQIVEAMRPDDRAELFDELPAGVVKRVLKQLSISERQATVTILGYPEGTAGRVMTTEYVRLPQGLTVGDALEKIRSSDSDKETVYYAYVTDENRTLTRVVSLRQLIFARPDVFIRDLASDRVIKVYTETPQEETAQLMKRYDLLALPVVDRENRLVGIITIDDVVDILEQEATEDIQKIAGVGGGDESSLSHPLDKLRNRLPWLLGIMGLYIGASSAIAPFSKNHCHDSSFGSDYAIILQYRWHRRHSSFNGYYPFVGGWRSVSRGHLDDSA